MILCGWCHQPATPPRCGACGHEDPARPWLQRGEEPPRVATEAGRPVLDEPAIRLRYRDAKRAIEAAGGVPTVDALAEALDRSPRTIREWRRKYALR